ncbi:MAG: hypothetical protein L3J95_04335 [Thermoplasmata archaeon]|nr:hypothetical protein [Thermoplasmata archaeon]
MAVVAILVAASVLSGLYVAGVGPFHRVPHPGGPVTFRQAESAARGAVQGYQGGNWVLVAAGSADVRETESFPIAAVELALRQTVGNCSLDWLTSQTALAVPSFSGNLSAGTSPIWELVYKNSSVSGSGILIVSVVNGSAALTAQFGSGGTCTTLLASSPWLTAISDSLIDSPAAVAAAATAGGAAYLRAHPYANVTTELTGGFGFLSITIPPVWGVAFSLCSLAAPTAAAEPRFNATVNPVTGTVEFSQMVFQNCSGSTTLFPPIRAPIPVNQSLSFSAVTTASAGTGHWANATVLTAAHGIAFGNLSFRPLTEFGGAPSMSGWSVRALSSTGSLLAMDNLTTDRWTLGASLGISVGDRIALFSSTTALNGGTIVLSGVGAFGGVESLSIPLA